MRCFYFERLRTEACSLEKSSLSVSGLQGSGGIPLIRKLCYAVGGVPNQVTTAAMAVSLQIFLLDVVQVEVVLQTKILPVPTVTITFLRWRPSTCPWSCS